MYLSRLYIENYRSIKLLDISFQEGKNVIVGKNNAGKSNIISAIDLVLGESSPTYNKSNNILETDFYNGGSERIVIFCELARGIDEQFDYRSIYENSFSFKTHQRVSEWSDAKKPIAYEFIKHELKESSDGYIDFDSAMISEDEAGWDTKWIDLKDSTKKELEKLIDDKFNFGLLFWVTKETKGTSIVYNKEIRLLARENSDYHWQLYFKDSLRNSLLQSAIIPSFRDPSNQLKISNWSWYGKLLKNKIHTTPSLEKAFEEVNQASKSIFSGVTTDVFDNKLSTAFPGTNARFSLAPLSQDIYKQALIYIDDGFESTLQSKGSGIQSAVIIALFDYYIKNIVDRNGSALLAVEEPELFLHPHGRRVIAHRLDQFIGTGTDKKNQVIATTHASEFISVASNNLNLISVRKEGGQTKANNYSFGDDKKIKQILLRPQNTELFFSDFVILTEDAKLFIEEIAREMGRENLILGENWLNDNNISVVNSGGKQEFWKFVKICEELNIPYLILADFDFIRSCISEFYNKLGYPKFVSNKKSIQDLTSKIKPSGDYINKRMEELVQSNKTEDEKSELAQKYKNFEHLDTESQTLVNSELIKLFEINNIYILQGELEDIYKTGKSPSASKEQGVIETLGKLDSTNILSDFIETEEIKHILNLAIQKNCIIKTAEVTEDSEGEEFSPKKAAIKFNSLEEWPAFLKESPKPNDTRIEDIPF